MGRVHQIITADYPHHQQIVIRRTDSQNKTHYVFFNGESGDAISRGEGHEQPDQLQLLYYVDDGSNNEISYIMDTGYDSGGALTNSTWNDFIYHNVLYPSGEALNTPHMNTTKTRKVSDHNNMQSLTAKFENSITVLQGNLEIEGLSENGGDYFTDYRRNLLPIGNDNDTPFYIIDANSHDLDHTTSQGTNFEAVYHLQYFSDTQNLVHNPYEWSSFVFNNNPNLYLWKTSIAYQIENRGFTAETDFELREQYNGGSNYFASRIVDQGKPDATYGKTTVSFLQLSDSDPNLPERLITYINNAYHQAYSYKLSNSIIDVFIQRVKVDGRGGTNSEYFSDVIFTAPDADNIQLKLPGGKDYGFVRLKRNNGIWEIDGNYQVNLDSYRYYAYPNNTSISTKTFPSNANIYIGNSSTLTITGDVTLQPGTTVRLGPDAEIKVNSGGSIDADGVTFTTLDGGTGSTYRWKHIKLLGGGSYFTDCTFKGADNAIYNYGYNYVYSSEFTDNDRGVQVADGTLQLVGSRIHNTIGDQSGWVRGDGWLVTHEYSSSGYEPTRIQDADKGIKITDYGNVRSNHTRYTDNDDYHIYMNGQAELFAGSESYFGSSEGWNAFFPGPTDDIYNTSSNTAEANYNWWGSPTYPYSSRFYGSVTNDHPLSCDPTVDGTECSAIDEDDGGGCSPYCYQANISSTPEFNGDGISSEPDLGRYLPQVKQQLTELFSSIETKQNDSISGQLLRKAYGLVQVYDTDGSLREWAEWEQKLNNWQRAYTNDTEEVHPELGTAALVLSLSEALHREDYDKVLFMGRSFIPHLTSCKQRIARLSAQAIAWERTGQFGRALGAYQAMEHSSPPAVMSADTSWSAPDYSYIKAELTDSMENTRPKEDPAVCRN